MTRRALSVVIPVHNERARIADTVRAAERAVLASAFDAEIIIVDDGSSDGSGEAAARAAHRIPVRIVSQLNSGRFAARARGLEAAKGEYVLFLDSRVILPRDALAFLSDALRQNGDRDVWNAHCLVETLGNPYGRFWNVVADLAFSEYFSNPRTTSFDAASFDRFPKGTTCFFAPRGMLRAAFGAFATSYRDSRHANDDTPIIYWIAARKRVHISPEFACLYRPRTSLRGFARHAFHRGVVFLDGHGRRESRFFLAVLAFYPVSAACALLALKRPIAAPVTLAAVSSVAAALAATKGRSAREIGAVAALAPVYALAHGTGMWRGLVMLVVEQARGAEAGKET